jgi:hypothetical protein
MPNQNKTKKGKSKKQDERKRRHYDNDHKSLKP